ncbi:MAG: YkvA family protein, partial [Alcanivorax sp.]
MNNTKTITDEQAKAELDKRASKISDNDVKKILDQESDLLSKVTGAGGPLGKLLDDVKTLFSMIKDYWNGDYREVPWTTIAAAAAALAFVLSPIDLIPDF